MHLPLDLFINFILSYNYTLSQWVEKNNIFLMMLIMETTAVKEGKPRSFILCKPVIAAI